MKVIIYFNLLTVFLVSCGLRTANSIDSSDLKDNFKRDNKLTTKNMMTLPLTENPLVLRTDFSNENQWKTICDEIVTPDPEFGFIPYVIFVSDSSFQGFSEEQLLVDSSSRYNHSFVFIVDNVTFSNPEHPILCVGLKHNQGLKFRTIPSEMWGIENNLSISNMDFEDFSNSVDKDGVFRGFK